MDLLAAPLEDLLPRVGEVVAAAVSDRAFLRASEPELATHVARIAQLARLVDALLVDAVGEVMRRSEGSIRDQRMTSHLGCGNVSELVQNLTRLAPPTDSRLQRAAAAVRPAVSDLSGELLPAPFPAVRDALLDGTLGIDGVLAITGPLRETEPRVRPEARHEAERIVVDEARGRGPDGAPPACAELLRIRAQVWALALDQDGAEPRERVSARKRAVTLGIPTAAGVTIRGMLMPEVAAQLQTIFDAHLSPKVSFAPDHSEPSEPDDGLSCARIDERTRAQKQHDALASALTVAAASGQLPTVGGYAPTLVVSVDEEQLVAGTGFTHAHGCEEPASTSLACHTACVGVIQRVISRGGRIVAIGTEERVFNCRQRRAIALRDGGCVIPGCRVAAGHHIAHPFAAFRPEETDRSAVNADPRQPAAAWVTRFFCRT